SKSNRFVADRATTVESGLNTALPKPSKRLKYAPRRDSSREKNQLVSSNHSPMSSSTRFSTEQVSICSICQIAKGGQSQHDAAVASQLAFGDHVILLQSDSCPMTPRNSFLQPS